MGVRGLRTFISERVRVLKRTLSQGSTLVIDGDGWMFHFIQQCGEGLRMDTGGQYGKYASAITAEIKKLQSCGLKLVVLFDGPKNPLKERTSIERLKGREEEWTSLHKFCYDHSCSRNGNSFPLAPLCKEQLIAVLDKCSVRHLHCTYEADQEIALLVQQQNLSSATEIQWFAYALDTDYLIMKDCPYIEFGNVEINGKSACAPVWTRVDVCRGLYITEEQFLDFVLFLGNDYTASLVVHTNRYATMQRSFNGNARIIMQDWLGKVSNQRNVQLQACDLFAPPPVHHNAAKRNAQMQQIAELQFAMDYSRAFYNLEPLDHFYQHARLIPAEPCSSASCVFDFHHYSDISEGKFYADLGRYVKAAERMGTEGIDRGVAVHALTYLKRKCTSSAIASVTGPVVTDEHRAAIQMMLKQLQQRPTQMDNPAFRPRWEDLLAAYVYQKACALMLKSFPKGSFSGEHNTPVMIFDAVVFHTILRGMRVTVGQHAPELPISETARVEPAVALSTNVHSQTVAPRNNVPPVNNEPPDSAHELSLSKASKQDPLLASKLSVPKRTELLQKSMDERLSTEERTALRKLGMGGFMPRKVLEELGLEYLLNHSFVKAEKKALAKQSGSDRPKPGIPSDPSVHTPLPMFSAAYKARMGYAELANLDANSTIASDDQITTASDLPAAQTAQFAHTQINSGGSLPSDIPSINAIPRYQAPRGSPRRGETQHFLTKAERKAERKAKIIAERRVPWHDTMHAQPKPIDSRVMLKSPSNTASFPLLEAAPLPVPSNPFEELPIDEHREAILRHIQSNRVTIIHGETGCGKSSRLPQFLLEDAEASHRHCKIFVSQPRRIGVVGMLKRLRPMLGDKVGMRMGHGVRDETAETKLHYVTTGYLVQLVAHHPEALKRCTHIVIDEVHERSVDGDLICLLVRDLLLEYSHLRVILMSATMNTDLYQEYFSQSDDGSFGRMNCLSVGVKRFPVEVIYLEDLLNYDMSADVWSDSVGRSARKVLEEKMLLPAWVEAQYGLVVALLCSVCKAGSTVLVFISGMDDITNIATLLEPYPQFLVCPLHSTTPEEEQDLVFEPTPLGNIKVVLATNMAESSVTIPDCDVVICLGTHKAVSFSDSLQRTHIAFGLLSRASATQRAGRTGRVRPGTVYRLYTKDTYQKMSEHELAEVLRRPLEDVVLNMWTVLENAENFQGVTPFLNRLIEAPDVRYIDKSYEKLFEASLITFPSDDGNLTPAGRFVSALPLDLALGRMLSYGVLLGVPAEAVVMAAALSLSRTPYRIANPIFLDPEHYNGQIRRRLLSEMHYDQGDYSEPIALVRLLLRWRALDSDRARHIFCHKNNVQFVIMRQFESAALNLAQGLSRILQSEQGAAVSMAIDSINTMSSATVNILRLVMVWSFSDNLMQLQSRAWQSARLAKDDSVGLKSGRVTNSHLQSIFGTIPFELHVPTTDTRIRSGFSFNHPLDCFEPDPYLRLARLVDTLAKVATVESMQCFAVITETPDPDNNLLVFVTLPGENQYTLAEQFRRCKISSLAVKKDYLAQHLALDCPHIGLASVFTCDNVDQDKVKCMYDMLSNVLNALILTVSVDGGACLNSTSIKLDPINVALAYGVVVARKKDAKPFAMKKVPKNKTSSLRFPREEENAISATSLIRDLPIGHRLLQCCRAGRKNMKLVLKLQASEVTEDDRVEGPYKVKRQEKCPQLEVAVSKLVVPVWRYLHNESCFQATLPRQSMMSTSYHCGSEPLFAVTHSALPVTKPDRAYFVVDGVTFLPTNPYWLQLALRATGKDHVRSSLFEDNAIEGYEEADEEEDEQLEENWKENEATEKLQAKVESQEIPQHLLDLARDIHNDVQEAQEFVRRDDIIAKVNTLFTPFIGEASVVRTEAVKVAHRLENISLACPDNTHLSEQSWDDSRCDPIEMVAATLRSSYIRETTAPIACSPPAVSTKKAKKLLAKSKAQKSKEAIKSSQVNARSDKVHANFPTKAKVVSLPPSALKAIIAPKLTKREQKINQSHGFDQALAFKLAHEARKRAAADAALLASNVGSTASSLQYYSATPSLEGGTNASVQFNVDIPKKDAHNYDANSGGEESCEEDDWETNAAVFSARIQGNYLS